MIICLNNSINEASFDFMSNLIILDNREEKHKEAIEDILKINLYDATNLNLTTFEINILSTVYHEITHFLDITTTAWGLEFIIRKTNMILKKSSQTKEVFELNAAELEMHNSYTNILSTDSSIKLLECHTEHGLIYDDRFGSLIQVLFFSNKNDIVLETPISMLSVLETNAFCSETLTKIRCIEINPNHEEHIIELMTLNNQVNDYLNTNEDSEYKTLFILTKRHFKFLELKELCIFLKLIIQDVLNMGMLQLSTVSMVLGQTFIDKHIGNSIVHDINRGMSRHIIVFKFILILYSYINEHQNKDLLERNLKNNPRQVLKDFYTELNIDFGIGDYPMEVKLLKESDVIFDTNYILESIETNKRLVQGTLDCFNNISSFKLFDIFLGDLSIVHVPNRLNINIDSYSSHKDIPYVDKIVKAATVKKQHTHPLDVPTWYQ